MQHCCYRWFETISPQAIEKAFDRALMQGTTLRGRLRGRSLAMMWRNIKNNLYGKSLVILGYLMRGRPYYYMMNGIPREATVFRPRDGYRGFPLTVEDLAKKKSYLENLA
jgi:hypothetical protein